MGAYINSLSMDDRTFLVAMAEKRGRRDQNESNELPATHPVNMESNVEATRSMIPQQQSHQPQVPRPQASQPQASYAQPPNNYQEHITEIRFIPIHFLWMLP